MLYRKLLSALFYGLSSLFIVFANKIVLTTYSFPSFQILALGQLTVTLFGLIIANAFNFIKLPDISMNMTRKIMPLPILYFGNLLFGLGGTKSINLPMFTALRRFSVLITMYGELYILRMNKPIVIQISIYVMVLGALIAAYDDLAFDFYGYVYIFLNDIFTALNGIFTKDKLDHSNLGENGLLYYNAFFTIFPMLFLSLYTGEIRKLDDFEHWFSFGFWTFFILSSVMGFLLNYSCMLCTKINSPLTTTVIGCLKNILVTYVGMFVGGDYVFSNLNFVGLTVSACSSVFYSYLTFRTPSKKQQQQLPNTQTTKEDSSLFSINRSNLEKINNSSTSIETTIKGTTNNNNNLLYNFLYNSYKSFSNNNNNNKNDLLLSSKQKTNIV